MEEKKIYSSILGVMGDIGAISKDKKNEQQGQGYMYRGIDQIYNALQPAMIKNGVFVTPDVLSEEREERTNAKGSVIFRSRLKIKFTFYATDGSSVDATTIGEAMDTGDKATNKAMSVAYKYACFQVFCIPTEEMKDPDADTHTDIKPQPQPLDAAKVAALKGLLKKKGVAEKAILKKYDVGGLEYLTEGEYKKVYEGLETMPDKEVSNDSK